MLTCCPAAGRPEPLAACAEFEHGKSRVKDLPCSSPDPPLHPSAPFRPRAACASSDAARPRRADLSRRPQAVRDDLPRRLPLRLDPDRLDRQRLQSQARWSFQPSQAETRHIAATSSSCAPGRRREARAPMASSTPTTIAPGIDDIVRGDRARRLRLRHGRRQEGVERHDEHAAGDRHAEQREDHQPGHRVEQEIAERREVRARACPTSKRRNGAAARTRPSRSPRPARSAPRPRSSASG